MCESPERRLVVSASILNLLMQIEKLRADGMQAIKRHGASEDMRVIREG